MYEIHQGDCREVMGRMRFGLVHCIVTSPPYWALRDYKTPGQLGLEPTPEQYVAAMVEVFRAAKRILRDDGVLWLNLGDCYATGAGKVGNCPGGGEQGDRWSGPTTQANRMPIGLKAGNLVGIPWRVALALQADGWILRRDNIWSKPNPMPESVNGWRWERCRVKINSIKGAGKQPTNIGSFTAQDGGKDKSIWQNCPGCAKCEPNGGYILRKGSGRCTTAHEYIFQFVKTGDYYYDCEAVREAHSRNWGGEKGLMGMNAWARDAGRHDCNRTKEPQYNPAGRNRRSVWEIATQPYPEAHFATYPEDLIEPCIKASTSEKGCCPACGSPWARILEDSPEAKERLGSGWHDHQDDIGLGQRGAPPALTGPAKITHGWRKTCNCPEAPPIPCTVFDPFTGSGTTGAVAVRLGCDFIGAELNPEYIRLAEKRIAQATVKVGTASPADAEKLAGPVQLGLWGREE